MGYDVGAAQGYLYLDISDWVKKLGTAQTLLDTFAANARTQLNVAATATVASLRTAAQNTARDQAAARVVNMAQARQDIRTNAQLAVEGARRIAAESVVAAKTSGAIQVANATAAARQQTAAVTEEVRGRGRRELAEVRHGYRMQEMAAREADAITWGRSRR